MREKGTLGWKVGHDNEVKQAMTYSRDSCQLLNKASTNMAYYLESSHGNR